jgi:hypothetical protein
LMPAERVYVGAVVNGQEQFFQRDTERKSKDGRWESVPYFVINRSEATTMSEAAAKIFVARLRSLKVNSAFIEDARDGRRIEFASESVQSGKDTRLEVAATLDDENSPEARWYKVKPANTPNGPKWFLHIDLPGVTDPQIIYADDPLGVLQRAEDVGFLQHAVKYERPQPQQSPVQNSSVVRRRPGDRYND